MFKNSQSRSIVVKNLLCSTVGPGLKLAYSSLFLAAAGIAVAQTPAPAAPFKVGIINAQAALMGTKDGQKAQQEMEQKLGPKYTALQKLSADIQDKQKRLEQGGNTLLAASKTELQNSIAKETRDLQRDQQDFQDEQQKEEGLVLADLETKMQGVIKQYAVDNGFSLILNLATEQNPIVWASDGIEITPAIIEAYDKAAPVAPKAAAPKTQAPSAAKPIVPSTTPPKPPATGAPKP